MSKASWKASRLSRTDIGKKYSVLQYIAVLNGQCTDQFQVLPRQGYPPWYGSEHTPEEGEARMVCALVIYAQPSVNDAPFHKQGGG